MLRTGFIFLLVLLIAILAIYFFLGDKTLFGLVPFAANIAGRN